MKKRMIFGEGKKLCTAFPRTPSFGTPLRKRYSAGAEAVAAKPPLGLRRPRKGLGAMLVVMGLLSLMVMFPLVISSASEAVLPRSKSGLEVVKSAPDVVEAGEVMVYTIAVTNTASEAAIFDDDILRSTGHTMTDVLVTDHVPIHTTYVSGSMSAQAGVLTPTLPVSITAGNELAWTIGSLGVDESITMTFQVTVAAPLVSGTHIVNTALVSDTPGTVTTTVHSTADLTVTKTVTPRIVLPGKSVTYTISITNLGNGIAEQVTIQDTLAPGFQPTQKTWLSQTVVHVLTLTLTVMAPQAEGTFYNWVTVTHDHTIVASGPTAPITVVRPRIYVPLIVKGYLPPPPPRSWHQGGGMEGLTVFSVAACPANCSILYASTKENGVYGSQDGARTWTPLGLPGARTDWVAVQSDNCDVAYAATWGSGVQKTVNRGLDWAPANTGLGDLFLYTVAIAPDSTTLYAGTSRRGVYRSVNAGGSWMPVNAGLPSGALVDALAIDPTDPQVLYAGTWGDGVFKSANGGGAWSAANNGLGDKEVYALAVDAGNTQILYAGTRGNGVYRSGDGAGSWLQEALPGQVAYTVTVGKGGLAFAGTEDSVSGNVVYQRSAAGVWQAMNDQPVGALVVRNLSQCEPVLLAGTANGAWWYGSE